MRLLKRRAMSERLEARMLLSGTYVVPEVDLALSQPQINYTLTRPGDPNGPLGGFFGTAFLDTGTSGNIISNESATGMGVHNQQYHGSDILFQDVGVSGPSFFNVSEPLQLGLANYVTLGDSPPDNAFGPAGTMNFEVNPIASSTGDPLDIIGMPAIMGKTMVVDPKPLFDPNNIDDMRTYLYNPATAPSFNAGRITNGRPDPGIPSTSLNVQFTYSNFAPYTTTDPAGAPGPTLASNPIIGPDPLRVFQTNPPVDNTPPVSMSLNGTTTTGSFLFDTGAAASFMSQDEASKFGVFYRAGTYGTDSPILVDANNNPIPNQSVLPLGGTDNNVTNVSEFYIDSLSLQTTGGVEIRFLHVPMAVIDINLVDPATGNTLVNPQTHKPFVLDGDFGVNPLLGTRNSGADPAFNWITFDSVGKTIGFDPSGTISSGTATVSGRHLFYNNSIFDGHNPAANAADDNAIAADKAALQASDSLSSFENITSSPAGVNGIMLDISGATGTPKLNDFSFSVGNSNNGALWNTLSTQPTLTLRPGAGGGGALRLELTWPDGTIRNEWLQVTVAANGDTGLPSTDTFLFGSLVGDSGQPTLASDKTYTITAADVTAAQNDPHGFTSPVNTFNTHDYNRDGRVDVTDQLIARYSAGNSLAILGTVLGAATPAATPNVTPAVTPANTTKHPSRKAVTAPTILSQVDVQLKTKAFKIRKQHAIKSLKALIALSANIKNPKVRKQLVTSYRTQLASVRAATLQAPGVLASDALLL